MNQPDPQLDRLLSALTEGPLDADQRAALNDLLRRDPARIEAYIDHLALHSLLRTELCAPQPIALTGIQGLGIRDQGSGPRDQNKTSPMASPRAVGVALAATILLALTAWFALPDFSNPQSEIRNPQSFASVATLTNTTNAAFADTAAPMRLGGSLPAGPIHLTSGKAQLMFASTATVDLQGPCEFEMTGPNRGRLTSGSLEARVPPQAKGFTIDLPDGSRIVDLGTAFRVTVDKITQIEVYDGLVEYRDAQGTVTPIHNGRLAIVVQGRLFGIGGEAVLSVNFDDADDPLEGSAPGDYRTYTGQGATVQFASGIGSDSDVGVTVNSPFFRNTNDRNYGDVTALDPSGDPTTGYNTVMNSGALVNSTDQTITVELSDLKAGRYTIRFFLHNIFKAGYEADDQGVWSIAGDGGVVEDVLATFGFNDPTNGKQGIPPTDLNSIGQIMLEFEALHDGDSARFTFTPDTLAASEQLWVNGFELHPLIAPAQGVDGPAPTTSAEKTSAQARSKEALR